MDRYATLRNRLVGAWCPSLGATGYTLIDRSPYNRHGTLTNMGGQANWQPGGFGASLAFDGNNDFVETAPVRTIEREWTISVHFAASSTSKTRHSLYSNSDTGNSDLYFHIESVSGSTCALNLYSGASNRYLGVSSSFSLNTAWTHYAVSCSAAGNVTYYRNGVAIGVAANTWGYLAPTGPACIGGIRSYLAIGFTAQGNIDDCRIYTRCLLQSEIAILASRRGIGLTPQRTRRVNTLGSQFWLRDAGTWKTATPWINVGGTWKKGTPKLRTGGVWKG